MSAPSDATMRVMVSGSTCTLSFESFSALMDGWFSTRSRRSCLFIGPSGVDGWDQFIVRYGRENDIPVTFQEDAQANLPLTHVVVFWDGKDQHIRELRKRAADRGASLFTFLI